MSEVIEQIFHGQELFMRYSGPSSATEVRESLNRHHGNSLVDEVTDVIVDFLHCDNDAICPGMLNEVAAFVRVASVTNPRLKVAVITDKPEVILATEVCAAFGSTHYPIQTFAAIDAARQWFSRTPCAQNVLRC